MNSKSFIRKIVYIALIGVLLIPLMLVSKPKTLGRPGSPDKPGGKLAQLRDEYRLSQTRVSEIDPTSETMKLLSLGLRGVAVNLLWLQAQEDKKRENYDQLETTLNALIKIQPNFVKVWEYQAHNLSYNISMEFDDYESRYHWVKKGIRFLTTGIPYNLNDHRITDQLGMFTGMKIGNADERIQFREKFRNDAEFHEEMSPYIDPDSYRFREPYKHDHWKMAYWWFEKSRVKVESQSEIPHLSDLIFYMKRPAQLRNQAMSLQKEFRSDELIKEIWASAEGEWAEYGKRPLKNSFGVEYNLTGMAEVNKRIDELRIQLDSLAPDARGEVVTKLQSRFNIPPEIREVMDKPADQRTDEESAKLRLFQMQVSNALEQVDIEVFQHAPVEKRVLARQILDQILKARADLLTIDRDQGTSNYKYWSLRNRAEAQDDAITAHQQLFDATELQRKSIFDDEFVVDPKTNDKKITRRGAITTFIDSFASWAGVFKQYPDLQAGDLCDNLVDSILDFQDMLKITGLRWPDNFPLQSTIDLRAQGDDEDGLPTTKQLEEERSAREDSSDTTPPPTESAPIDKQIIPSADTSKGGNLR